MLTLLLRMTLVLLAVLIGITSGPIFNVPWFPAFPPWFGAAMGFGAAIILIASEQAFGRRLARSMVAFLISLALGLALSLLMLSVLHLMIRPEISANIDLPIALMTTYLVMITVLRNIDRWRVIVPFVEFRSERIQGGPVVVDATVLADNRLIGLLKSGILHDRILIHRRVLDQLELSAHAEDAAEQLRARRALDGLVELRALLGLRIEIDPTDVPNAERVDDLLIRFCRLENGRLCSNDRALLQRAQAEGLPLIDLASLTQIFAPVVRAGDTLALAIERPGEGKGQGIGFLPDGSMVVVSGGGDQVGRSVQVTVMRTHPTANGRMVFAEVMPESR